MKPLSQDEISVVVSELQSQIGWLLQDNLGSDDQLGLLLYGGKKSWIWLDLKQPSPILLPVSAPPVRFRKAPKPIHEFIHRHGRGLPLTSVKCLKELGRVIELIFSSANKTLGLKVSLVPHFANVEAWTFAHDDPKKSLRRIFWKKPKPLPQPKLDDLSAKGSLRVSPNLDERPTGPCRSLSEMSQDWLGSELKTSSEESALARTSPKEQDLAILAAQLRKMLQKQERILAQLRAIDPDQDILAWKALGEHLKTYGFTGLSPDDRARLKSEKLSDELDRCFETARSLQEKKKGRTQRITEIQREIERDKILLDSGDSLALQKRLHVAPKSQAIRKNSGKEQLTKINYRTHTSSQGFDIRIGRSGVENLKLLRSAAPWFFWLHVRDQPGSFGIVLREKNQNVPLEDLRELAVHLVRQSLPAKQRAGAHGRYEVLCAECRFVQPVKNAKPGMVTYRSEKVFSVDL